VGGEETETELSIPGQEEQVSLDTLVDTICGSANGHTNAHSTLGIAYDRISQTKCYTIIFQGRLHQVAGSPTVPKSSFCIALNDGA
jgi:hypothetical protein